MKEFKRIKIKSFSDVLKKMKQLDIEKLSDFFILYESLNQGVPRETIMKKMKLHLSVMRDSIEKGKTTKQETPSGMIQGGAYLVGEFQKRGKSLISHRFTELIHNLLAVAECNACMGKIVAAPTAGACGVIPGSLIYIADMHRIKERRVIESLFIAGGIGEVIALQASLAGASHGCQAENGSASAMAAAGIVSLFTTNVNMIESAAAFALKNVLGLVCDPIAGLVEVPCVKRNVMAGINAVASAEMALAGIQTIIPFDEVVDAMKQIGNSLPSTLKETSLGGLAATETGRKIAARFKKM